MVILWHYTGVAGKEREKERELDRSGSLDFSPCSVVEASIIIIVDCRVDRAAEILGAKNSDGPQPRLGI